MQQKILLTKQLIEQFPSLYDNDVFRRYGGNVGPGWATLVMDLSEEIKAYPIHVVNIKEKLGALEIYAVPNQPGAPLPSEVRSAIFNAVAQSKKTCEFCGNAGEPFLQRGHWWKVVCEEHQEKGT